MIYKIQYDYKECYLLTPDLNDLATKMPSYSQRFRAKPRLESWVAPKFSFFASENYEGEKEQLPDISLWALGNLVLSPKAYEVFKDMLTPSGEFLPLIIGDETYYMLNPLFVIPEEGIDRSHEVEVVDTGVHMGQSNVLFNEAALDGRNLFKTPTDKLRASYCTKAFKELYEQHAFKGLLFEEVTVR
jgi:hypothetical protein